jgi:iron complex outermembrane receptor protein
MDHSDLEIGLTGAGVLDPVTRASDSRYNVDLFYNDATFSKNWGLDAELRYQHLDYTSGDGFQERPPGYTDGTDVYPEGILNLMRSAERRINAEVSGLYTGISSHTVRLGAGHTWQDLYSVEQFINSGIGPNGIALPPGGPLVNVSDTPYAFAPEKIRNIDYLFLQDVWAISDDLELTAGARYDDYSDFGGTFNPRLALVWENSDSLTTKLMYGQAFRAPSYQELFADTSFAQANADLDPERSQTIDLAFAYTATKDLRLNLNLFNFAQRDLIRAVGSPRQFQNTGDHTIRGIELEAQWQVVRTIRIAGNYTYRHQDNSEYRAIDEPDQDAYLRLDWGFQPEWNWNLQTNWIGQRTRATTDTRPPVEAYFITDTTIRYAHIDNWEFAASVRNLFDVDAREYTGASIANDLPLAERHFYTELRYKF